MITRVNQLRLASLVTAGATFLTAFFIVSSTTAALWALVPGKYSDVLIASSIDKLAPTKPLDLFLSNYGGWLSRIGAAHLGISEHWQVPVARLLYDAACSTLWLALLTTFVVAGIAVLTGAVIPLGAPTRARSILSTIFAVTSAIPVHLTVLVVVVLLAGHVEGSAGKQIAAIGIWTMAGFGHVAHVWLAALDRFAALPCHATALAQGCSRARVYWKHAFRYAWRETVPTLLQFFFACATGSVIVETALGMNGLGRVAWDSWRYRDFPVLMGLSTFFFVLYWVFDGRETRWAAR